MPFPDPDEQKHQQTPEASEDLSKEASTCEETSRGCPICLHEYDKDLRKQVSGFCNHCFCLDCLERLLTAPSPLRTAHSITTMGSCPLCRASISLFDLKAADETNEKRRILFPSQPQWWLDTPMPAEAVYASSSDDDFLPRINFPRQGLAFCCKNDTSARHNFTTAHYHAPTQTFVGQYTNDDASTVRVVLTFSYDWQFVTRGVLQYIVDEDDSSDRSVRLGGTSGLLLRLVSSQESSSQSRANDWRPTYHADTLFGNSFCQALTIGLASYHFQSLEDSYISYENPATAQWPPLDNGMPVPSRVPFRECSTTTTTTTDVDDNNNNNNDDGSIRTTFRGHICWLQDFGTAWQGSIRWEYEMHFDSTFLCIVGGRVRSVSLHPDGTTELTEDMSVYGETLNYVNAASFDVFRESLLPGNFRDISQSLRERLEREGVSVRTLAPMHHVLMQAFLPDATNPFDFNNNNH